MQDRTSVQHPRLLAALAGRIAENFKSQVWDENHPEHGGVWVPESGRVDASSFGGLSAVAAAILSAQLGAVAPADAHHFRVRSRAALAHQRRALRDSGRIDLLGCNFDSAPDTAFVAMPLAAVASWCEDVGWPEGWADLRDPAMELLHAMAVGIAEGGVHTPNHRWVICGALAWLHALFPGRGFDTAIHGWLAEGIDCDDEGFFIERSVAVYDGFCDRALLAVHHILGHEASLDAVRRNLEVNRFLIDDEGYADTSLSHRQDSGQRVVPINLADSYLIAAKVFSNDRLEAVGHQLIDAVLDGKRTLSFPRWPISDLFWPALAFARTGSSPSSNSPTVHTDASRRVYLPSAGYWSARGDGWRCSVAKGGTSFLQVWTSRGGIKRTTLAHSFLGQGFAKVDALEVDSTGVVTAVYAGHREGWPDPPAYFKASGGPVEQSERAFAASMGGRSRQLMPHPQVRLRLSAGEDGLRLEIPRVDFYDGVSGLLAFDFTPGGIWECDGCLFEPVPGQVIRLAAGIGSMRYGNTVIEVGPGRADHLALNLRDGCPPDPGAVRVQIGFVTPYEHKLTIRVRRGIPGSGGAG